jgi:hypothetical protein
MLSIFTLLSLDFIEVGDVAHEHGNSGTAVRMRAEQIAGNFVMLQIAIRGHYFQMLAFGRFATQHAIAKRF